ncbi:hypothetical protein GCM10027360_70260 [Amycolatopsis echigonensis]
MELVGLVSEVDALDVDDGWPPVELLPVGGFGAELSDDGGFVGVEVSGGVVTGVEGGVVVPPEDLVGGGGSLRCDVVPPGTGCPPPG